MQTNLEQYKVLFLIVTAVLALLVASPALQHVLVYPQTEFFTEFGMLGPGRMAENYPYNITAGQNYTLFLDVANHLGSCAYCVISVKFRNATQSAPGRFDRTPSSLAPLLNLPVFVADKESLEVPFSFGIDYSFKNVSRVVYSNVTVPGGAGKNATVQQVGQNVTLLQVEFKSLNLNGANFSLRGLTADWNSDKNQFYGNLIFELWVYDDTTDSFDYNERFVDLKLNMTSLNTTILG